MGEAKRRKQLGLMPTVYPFEAELKADASATLLRAPDDQALRQALVRALEETQLSGPSWDSEYRTAYVMTGRQHAILYTAQDVQGIPVPPLRRISGEIVLGKTPDDVEGPALPVPGGVVRLREQRHSFDGQRWETFPSVRDPQKVRRILDEHPAFAIQGESVGQFRVEQWAEGRIDIDPDPPEGALDLLEVVAREWHGDTPEKWAQFHAELVGEGAEPPAIRRTYFELRRPGPLHNPAGGLYTVRGGYEIYPLVDPAYSPDGENWFRYDDPEGEAQDDDLMQAFAEMLNMETVAVTVYADGRVEWDEGEDISDEHAERVRADLRQSTGAGDPAKWAAWSRQMLIETFNGEETEGEMPVPQAVRLDLAKDAIADPDPLSQTFIESEVTFDGETWRDLYDEEMPPELLLAVANMQNSNQTNQAEPESD